MGEKIYTGIGSRETPPDIMGLMTKIAQYMATQGYILRSGGAPGADSAFETGAKQKEIYLPWPRFNDNRSLLTAPSKEAFELAKQYHPRWGFLPRGAKALHARNCHQVLGRDLNSPTELVICWTKNGDGGGGTGQAIRIANSRGIKVYDLAKPAHRQYWQDKINGR